jgi:hypothetical protein
MSQKTVAEKTINLMKNQLEKCEKDLAFHEEQAANLRGVIEGLRLSVQHMEGDTPFPASTNGDWKQASMDILKADAQKYSDEPGLSPSSIADMLKGAGYVDVSKAVINRWLQSNATSIRSPIIKIRRGIYSVQLGD